MDPFRPLQFYSSIIYATFNLADRKDIILKVPGTYLLKDCNRWVWQYIQNRP